MSIWESDPPLRVCCCWLLKAVVIHLFIDFSKLFLLKLHFLLCVITETLFHYLSSQSVTWQEIPWNGWRKNTTTTSPGFCSLALSWGTTSVLSQFAWNSALVFTSWLRGAQRSAKGASLGSSQVFSAHASVPGHALCMMDFPNHTLALQSPYFPM